MENREDDGKMTGTSRRPTIEEETEPTLTEAVDRTQASASRLTAEVGQVGAAVEALEVVRDKLLDQGESLGAAERHGHRAALSTVLRELSCRRDSLLDKTATLEKLRAWLSKL